MWVIFGTSEKDTRYKGVVTRYCPKCRDDRPFSLQVKKKNVDFYWLIELAWKKEYRLVCDRCGTARELRPDKAEELIRKIAKGGRK